MVSNRNENINIAICGGLRSGKDTVGDMLQSKLNAERFAFSDGIWKTVELLFPEDYVRRGEQKPRSLLQNLGQKLREVKPNIWVDYTLNRVAETESNVIISDLRQPNEFEALDEAGFIIIRVNSDISSRIERAKLAGDNFDKNSMTHETESHYPLFVVDYDIDNNGSMAELEDRVEGIVEDIAGGRF